MRPSAEPLVSQRAMKLRIQYRDNENQVSERIISDVVLEPPEMLNAFCHLRGENRSFVLSRIEQAVDLATGNTISDIWFFSPKKKRGRFCLLIKMAKTERFSPCMGEIIWEVSL